jgi:hypothetical protein
MRLSRPIVRKSFLGTPFCRVASILAALGILLISSTVVFSGRTFSSGPSAASVARARLGASVTAAAAGRGRPWINMTDGQELITSYAGSNEAVEMLARGQAQPLSLASGDFDEDGMPDLVTGYGIPGGGLLTLERGNVDSVYKYTREAKQRKASGDLTDAPFLSPGAVFEAAVVPEILLQGDFDADDHADLIAATRGSNTIHLLTGDGRGNLSAAKEISLPGKVTAITSGEVNRADGLIDLVVAIDAPDGPRLMVFEGTQGAVKATPEGIPLPAPATQLLLGNFSSVDAADIAVATGNELLVVNGRDRKLSLGSETRATVRSPRISRRSFPSALISLAVGDFTGGPDLDLAVMLGDSSIQIISAVSGEAQSLSSRLGSTAITLASGLRTRRAELFCARMSSLSHENLVMVDRENNQLHVWMDDEERRGRGDGALELTSRQPSPPVTFDTEREPVAILPMRLNGDALSDLVVLRADQMSVSVLTTLSNTPIVVCTTSDSCSNCGSLRDAIVAANATPGLDTIQFSNQFSGIPTVSLQSSLPTINEAIAIIGSAPGSCSGPGEAEVGVQSANGIGLDGGNFLSSGFTFSGGGSTITDFVVGRFTSNGIQVTSNGGNIVQGNFIGLGTDGSTPRGNGIGVRITTRANTVGGTVGAASNVISSNGTGVVFDGVNATDNNLRLNSIGTDVSQSLPRGNQLSGVLITNGASRNVIGGSIVNTGNAIASNRDGVGIASGSSNLIQRNQIVSNTRDGVLMNSAGNTVGGTTDITRNGLFFNGSNGVEMSGSGASDNLVQDNFIGVNFDANGSALDRGNAANGVALTGNATRNAVGGAQSSSGNYIALNSANGVFVASGNQNLILSNRIFNNVDLPIRLAAGANGDQAPPALVAASVRPPALEPTIAAVTLNVTVNFTGTPGQIYTLDFYLYTACDCKGKDCVTLQPRLLGLRNIGPIDSSGTATVTYPFTLDDAPPPAYGFVNATATSANNNTSQFSQCVQIGQTQAGGDFSLGLEESTVVGLIGTKGRITVLINRTGGFTGEVTVTPAPKFNGVKPKPPAPIATTESSVFFKYKIAEGIEPSTRMLTFSGTDASGRVRTTTATMFVQLP